MIVTFGRLQLFAEIMLLILIHLHDQGNTPPVAIADTSTLMINN